MNADRADLCYLCGTPLRSYRLSPGETPPPDARTKDHVPPEGLFNPPLPSDLIKVPCCRKCNGAHSGFDERLRIMASMPFDRNASGQQILEERVLSGTLAKGRQMKFVAQLVSTMRPIPGNPDLVRYRIEAQELKEGIIRITKGLLWFLHPNFAYHNSVFEVLEIRQKSSDEQLRLMAMLKRADYLERGNRTFECWRHIEEKRNGGAWMMAFYQCFAFFVFHSNEGDLDRFFAPAEDRDPQSR